MPGVSSRIFELVDRIDTAPSTEAVWAEYMNAARAAGLPYAVACIHPTGGDVTDHVLAEDLPKGWLPHYAAQGYAQVSPVLHASQHHTPFLWEATAWDGRLSREQRSWRDDVLGAGLDGGLSIPDHADGVRKSLIVCGPLREVAPDDLTALRLAGAETLRRMHELDSGLMRPAGRMLSPREAECLTWVAQGKSDWEIGQILGLSEKTVNHHVEHAKQRLSVTTRVQAVVAAVVGRLIHP